MADIALSRLRRQHQLASGLLFHDWGDSAAVVFVPGTGTTHLIDGATAGLLVCWNDDFRADQAATQAPAVSVASTAATASLEPQGANANAVNEATAASGAAADSADAPQRLFQDVQEPTPIMAPVILFNGMPEAHPFEASVAALVQAGILQPRSTL